MLVPDIKNLPGQSLKNRRMKYLENQIIAGMIEKMLEITRNLNHHDIFLYKSKNMPNELMDVISDLTFLTLKLQQNRREIFDLFFEMLLLKTREINKNVVDLRVVLDIMFFLAVNQKQFFNLNVPIPIRFEWIDHKELSKMTDTVCDSIFSEIKKRCEFCIYYDFQEEKIRNIRNKIKDIEMKLKQLI